MRRLVFFLHCLAVTVTLQPVFASPSKAENPAALAARAREVLHEVMIAERSWVKIHAAEALIDAGEADRIHAIFLAELTSTENSAIRVGVWRVLARTAPTKEERAAWIARIERVYCDPKATDRIQAIETLGKLHHRVSGPALELVRQEAAGAPSVPVVLALWVAQLAGEPLALERLAGLLASPDPTLRGDAAYALRWLGQPDPAVRQALVKAAAVESSETYAYPYILGAAVAVDADAAQIRDWAEKLERLLMSGTTDARFEAAQTLKHLYPPAKVFSLAALLNEPANDARVGAANVILSALARQ
jgi:SSS family solute:Na+ symporter